MHALYRTSVQQHSNYFNCPDRDQKFQINSRITAELASWILDQLDKLGIKFSLVESWTGRSDRLVGSRSPEDGWNFFQTFFGAQRNSFPGPPKNLFCRRRPAGGCSQNGCTVQRGGQSVCLHALQHTILTRYHHTLFITWTITRFNTRKGRVGFRKHIGLCVFKWKESIEQA